MRVILSCIFFNKARKKWLEASPFYVKPRQIIKLPPTIDTRVNDVINHSLLAEKIVYQYVPILESVKALLAHNEIRNEYFKSVNNANETDSFYTSVNYKHNELYINFPDAIQIILYMDDFGTTSPCKDTKNDYKITGVYFKLGNLPGRFQGCNHFTQLALICFPEDLKRLGYEEVFEPIIDDILTLETVGIDIKHESKLVNLKGG